MNNIILILVYGLLSQYTLNADITGSGFAQTKSEAKKEALADLAGNIKSEVRSNFESHANDSGQASKSDIKISSNLPILGAEFSFIDSELFVESIAVLSPKNVSKLYINKLQKINAEIDSVLTEIKKTKSSSSKLNLYQDIYSLLNEYSRYESVAVILDVSLPTTPSINKAQVKIEIDKLNSNIDSISMASTILSKSFKQKNIFVYAPQLQNYTTVSEFGAVFQKNLKANVKSSYKLSDAKYILVGNYSMSKKSMVLNYDLLDADTNEVINSKTISINKKAYKDLKTKPKNIDFDALLNAGVINSSDLKVSLKSNKGSDSLLFRGSEEVELFIKLNKMGYVYIVGYTQTDDKKFSYLLELNEGHGDSKFKMFINADDANKWISLGAFTVEAPFGVESLQIIASNKKITTLPNTKYDEDNGYYVISKDIKKALVQTRGLKMKKSRKTEMSEDVLSFTTVK